MMKNLFLLYLILLVIYVHCLKEKSEELYECINPDKTIISSSECTSIKIPELDGYKCCSMEIIFNGNNSKSCFALENEFTKNQTILNEYIANISLSSLFGTKGGQMKIDCGDNKNVIINYEKISDEYLNCYKGHINGVNNETDCHKYNIPEKEKSKCCFMETQQKDNKGNIINDKRCYIIQDGYFSEKYNLNNYLLDKTKLKSLEEITGVNITINCKNYDIFNFQGKTVNKTKKNNDNIKNTETIIDINSDIHEDIPGDIPKRKKDSGISGGAIAAIIIVCAIILIGGGILAVYCIKKRKTGIRESDSIDNIKK